MTEHIYAATIVLVALFCVMIGWLAVLANGRRPVAIHVKGLGVDVRVSPCAKTCEECTSDERTSVPKMLPSEQGKRKD